MFQCDAQTTVTSVRFNADLCDPVLDCIILMEIWQLYCGVQTREEPGRLCIPAKSELKQDMHLILI